jgi:hypothetical protein
MSFGIKPSEKITYNILVDQQIVETFSLIQSLACKNVVYELSPSHPFAVLSPSPKSVTIKSIDKKEAGVFSFTLTAKPYGTSTGVTISTSF